MKRQTKKGGQYHLTSEEVEALTKIRRQHKRRKPPQRKAAGRERHPLNRDNVIVILLIFIFLYLVLQGV